MDGHSSGTPVAERLTQPTRATARKPACRSPVEDRPDVSPLFGFAPGGVYHAVSVASDAVRSYRTLSPLPNKSGGLLSVALSLRSPSPGVTRHRVPVEPGLSSPQSIAALKGDHPTIWHGSLYA